MLDRDEKRSTELANRRYYIPASIVFVSLLSASGLLEQLPTSERPNISEPAIPKAMPL